MRLALIALVALATLSGCTTRLATNDLHLLGRRHLGQLFYIGSDEKDHHFRETDAFWADRHYLVEKSLLSLSKEIEYRPAADLKYTRLSLRSDDDRVILLDAAGQESDIYGFAWGKDLIVVNHGHGLLRQ